MFGSDYFSEMKHHANFLNLKNIELLLEFNEKL